MVAVSHISKNVTVKLIPVTVNEAAWPSPLSATFTVAVKVKVIVESSRVRSVEEIDIVFVDAS